MKNCIFLLVILIVGAPSSYAAEESSEFFLISNTTFAAGRYGISGGQSVTKIKNMATCKAVGSELVNAYLKTQQEGGFRLTATTGIVGCIEVVGGKVIKREAIYEELKRGNELGK